jgi:hypothetical protein
MTAVALVAGGEPTVVIGEDQPLRLAGAELQSRRSMA